MGQGHVSDTEAVEYAQVAQAAVYGVTAFHPHHTGDLPVHKRVQ
jgi:hypothetical protein